MAHANQANRSYTQAIEPKVTELARVTEAIAACKGELLGGVVPSRGAFRETMPGACPPAAGFVSPGVPPSEARPLKTVSMVWFRLDSLGSHWFKHQRGGLAQPPPFTKPATRGQPVDMAGGRCIPKAPLWNLGRLTWRAERRFELATAQTPAQAWWPLDRASSTASVRSGRLEPAASTTPSVASRLPPLPKGEFPVAQALHPLGRPPRRLRRHSPEGNFPWLRRCPS